MDGKKRLGLWVKADVSKRVIRVLKTTLLVVTLIAMIFLSAQVYAPSAVGGVTPVHVSIVPGAGYNRSLLGYSPDVIHVVIGVNNTVVWTNNDNVTHTVTSTTGVFNSGLLPPGQSWNYTFTYPGTFNYYCTIHPWMKGTVLVEAPAGTSAPTNYTSINIYTGSLPSPKNPPGTLIAAGVFVLIIVGLVLGEISSRKTR
ncbi:MAG: cupredoxin domain-containing protein [Thermoprotei archaeon]